METQTQIYIKKTGAIPVGIAVARQRLQEHVQQQHQPKDINRFSSIGIATDLGKSNLSESLFSKYFVFVFIFFHSKSCTCTSCGPIIIMYLKKKKSIKATSYRKYQF